HGGHGGRGGPFDFAPLAGSAYGASTTDWAQPFLLPQGYTQSLVADETVLDVYAGADDLSDMTTVNETGRQAGRYLYRTHEVGENGAVSVVDLRTGEAEVIAQDAGWRRLDGLEWTPWGTLLFAEETTGGRLFEAFLDPHDPTVVTRIEARPQVGILRHEGIAATRDAVYVVDELNGGSIYKFVPARRGDLSQGQLYALKLTGLSDADQLWNPATYPTKVGDLDWVPLDMAQVVVDGDAAANAVGATEFGRPEDLQVIGDTLYVANTSEDRVIAIDLRAERVTGFVEAGVNVPVEDAANGVTGFNSPDNLAATADGRLIVIEDNVPSDIWFAGADRNRDGVADRVDLFASLVDPGAEGSGIYVGTDPRTLYVNVQHPDKPQADGTWRISRG
ncbi:hypothetical protein N867_04320, partial [Actinotalea fermentans ATCC 43279 = JCM 9966 = DSM 3133]